MTIKEAMETRHTVRKYIDRPIPQEIVQKLSERIAQNNEAHQLNLKLVTENDEAFGTVVKLIMAKNACNYIILAGNATEDTEEKIGYCGADIMLYAQTLGLNTWWIGGTYSKKGTKRNADLKENEKIVGIIAVGYGATQGTPHKSKKPEEISSYKGTAPEWFKNGVNAVLLAPTALNKQAFTITGEGNTVSMIYDKGVFSGVDLGIGKYHFEIGAGVEMFEWRSI